MNVPPRWRGAPAQMVFEDSHIRVMFKPGGSDMLLVTFGNADNLASGTRFYADTVAEKFGLNCLGFMAHDANWFPADSMRRAALTLGYTLRSFDIRVAHASSLGAYAALKYSALLGITHAVAFCPQWSIDPAECGSQDSGFRNLYRPEMAGMGIRPSDLAGDITVFTDPGASGDAYHTRMIVGLAGRNPACRVRVCQVHHVGHHVAPALRGSALAMGLLAACRLGRPIGELYALINPARRASVQRRRTLLTESIGRHPALSVRALGQLARAGQLAILDGSNCLSRLYRALCQSGGFASAADLIATVLPHVSSTRAALLRGAPDRAAGNLLTSVHGSTLCYSALDGCLVHGAWPGAPPLPGMHPVFVDDRGRLAIRMADTRFVCRSLDHQVTDPVPDSPGDTDLCFEAHPADGGALAFVAAERYLTALPDGSVYRIEAVASTWERFVEAKKGLLS